MKRIFLVSLLILFTGILVQAQTPYYSSLTYQISFPDGNTSNFISSTSFAGVGIEGRRFFGPAVSAGFSFDLNYFYQNNRSIYAYPMLFNVHIYLGKNWGFKPFLGFGFGTYYFYTRSNLGSTYTWHFGLSPEFGFAIRKFRNFGVLFSARYNYAFAAGGLNDQSYWTIKIGSFWSGY